MRTAVYPGSFDPVTYGHLDIIARGARIFERLIVAVLVNHAKQPLFTAAERCKLLREATQRWPGVEVDSFTGLLVNYVRQRGAPWILRGLRATSDFEYELQISSLNQRLGPEIETLFLMSNSQHSFISSGMVKEVAVYGAPLHDLVPQHVATALQTKLRTEPTK